jgi:Ca2+-binding RTX toxin-like protein
MRMLSFSRITERVAIDGALDEPISIGTAYVGTAGDDTQTGGADGDRFDFYQGGNDVLDGGGGDDRFNMGAALNAADHIEGGAGSDTLNLDGDYSAKLQMGGTTIHGIELLHLAAGHSYFLSLANGNVDSGAVLTVDASALAADQVLTLYTFGVAGAFAITGGAGGDVLALAQGNDTVAAGAGSDLIFLYGGLNANSRIDGGAGYDRVIVEGYGGAGGVLGPQSLINVESLTIDVTNPSPDQPYGVTYAMDDGNVGPGRTLFVNFDLDPGLFVRNSFDGSAETDGRFDLIDSIADDTVIGGAQADRFSLLFGGTEWIRGGGGGDVFVVRDISESPPLDPFDRLDGGAGPDMLILDGNYVEGLVLQDDTLVSIETLRFEAGHRYSITTDDGTVASKARMAIDGSALGRSDVLILDGSAESDGRFIMTGGAAGDILIGGARLDALNGGAGDDRLLGGGGGDTLTGGAGADVFAYTALDDSRGSAPDLIADFTGADHIDLRQIDADEGVKGNQAFHFGRTTGHAADLVVRYDAAHNLTTVLLYTDGDNAADAQISLAGDHRSLTAGDFML